MNNILPAYQNLNKSFEKKYVFQFGRGSGLGAESIGLFKCAIICLLNRIQFCLGEINRPQGFAMEKGWEDYFLPIFPIQQGKFLSLLNRPLFPMNRLPIARLLARYTLRGLYGNHLFMFDRLGVLPDRLIVKELGIDMDWWDAARFFFDMIWRPRQDVAELIEVYWEKSGLQEPFIAIHIRRGDKISESPYTSINKYLKALEQFSILLPIYVASDDSRVIKEFHEALPKHYDIINVMPNSLNGYDQHDFNSRPKQARWLDTVFFLFELDIMKRAEWFVGASPSNVFYLSQYLRGNFQVVDANNIT